MTPRTPDEERRSGIHWIAAALILLPVMLGLWWLVEETNEEGTHDAELLPLVALMAFVIGAYHLLRSRTHHA